MQVKQLKQDGLNHELEVTVAAKEINALVDKRLAEVSKSIKMPGFRPGKVPMDLMKKKYGKSVLGEVLETAVNESSMKAIQDNKIKPALQPKIEVTSFDEGKDLVFKMEVEALPEFTVENFKGMKLTKLVTKADDVAIDEALTRIASMRKSSAPIAEARATQSGDIVVFDFHGRTADDNVAHEGMHAHSHHLELGSGQFIPGFEEQLIGKNVGDKVEVKVSFPEEYGAAHLAGRDAIFDCDIHAIHEATAPVIDDEFAKSLGLDDLAALRNAVAEQTNKEFDGHSRLKLKKELLDQLDDAHDFDIPQGMKALELENITRQVQMDSESRGAAAELTEEEKEELAIIAERRVRLGLILSEIGNQNKISVADAELQRAVIREAQKYPGQEKQVFDYFSKNRQALESLRAPIYEDKVVDLILESAEITEKTVTVEELTSEDDIEIKPKKKAAAKKSDAKKADAEASSEGEDKKKAPAKKKAS